MIKQPTDAEIVAVKSWTAHNNLTKLREEIKKSRIGAYMTIARVYRHLAWGEHPQNHG